MTHTDPKDPTSPVCSVCNYNLAGIIPTDKEQLLICPECGQSLRPKHSKYIFTKKRLHKLLFRNLVLSLCAAPVLCLAMLGLADLFGFASELFKFTSILLTLVFTTTTLPVVFITTLVSAIEHARPHPRPIPLRLIPVLAMLYLIPIAILYMSVILLYAKEFL